MDPRVALRSSWLPWRPRAIAARADGLAIEWRRRVELVPWAELDAVIDLDPVRIESRGRVLARLDPDDDAVDALVAAVVLRAGLEWVEKAKRGKLPRMAVRADVAARLRG
jgi:hypothetical protein